MLFGAEGSGVPLFCRQTNARKRLWFHPPILWFDANGRLPRNLDEVNERDKDIRYASRTAASTEAFRYRYDVRHAINELHKLLPPLADAERGWRTRVGEEYTASNSPFPGSNQLPEPAFCC